MKDLFVRCIKALQDTDKFRWGVIDLASSINPLADLGILEYPDCSDALLAAIEVLFKDNEGWIGYYCFELNYGENYEDGDVVIDGEIMPLRTIDDLWEVLKKTNE